MDEEKRFKHKLNMLEPGSRMLKWIGILIVIGLLLYFFRFRMAAICVWAVSGIVFAVLLVLLAKVLRAALVLQIARKQYYSLD